MKRKKCDVLNLKSSLTRNTPRKTENTRGVESQYVGYLPVKMIKECRFCLVLVLKMKQNIKQLEIIKKKFSTSNRISLEECFVAHPDLLI